LLLFLCFYRLSSRFWFATRSPCLTVFLFLNIHFVFDIHFVFVLVSFQAPCQAGTYSAFGSCIACPPMSFSGIQGATSCTRCPVGQVAPSRSTSCSSYVPWFLSVAILQPPPSFGATAFVQSHRLRSEPLFCRVHRTCLGFFHCLFCQHFINKISGS
jgi:hypothetical protein